MKYDFIIAGGGLSGLSFCLELLRSNSFRHSSILLIDKNQKTENDRTWSFWATPREVPAGIPVKQWSKAIVYEDSDAAINVEMSPYVYNTIQGIDFYNYALGIIRTSENITRLITTIEEISANGIVKTSDGSFQGKKVIQSFFDRERLQIPESYTFLLQHFKGWVIQTPKPCFDADTITLMDFRTPQPGDTRFFYVLPFSETKALVEYTIFSKHMLEEKEYDVALENYVVNNLEIEDYKVLETEFSAIPMTDYPFEKTISQNIIRIATTAGYIKPSSGYGFKRTLERNRSLVQQLEKNQKIRLKSNFRFRLYDSILLYLLGKNIVSGKSIFSSLYRKHSDHLVFKFLDEKTSLAEELKVVWAVPRKWPFIKAFFRQLFQRI